MSTDLLEEAKSIQIELDEFLPLDIRDRMQRWGLKLTVSSTSGFGSNSMQFVDVDEEDLAEQDLAGDMVSLTNDRNHTGVDNTVFVSTKGPGRHAARIKIAIDPPDSLNASSETASMAIHDYSVRGAYMAPHLVEQAKQFIERNRDVLLGYWNCEFETSVLLQKLRAAGATADQSRAPDNKP